MVSTRLMGRLVNSCRVPLGNDHMGNMPGLFFFSALSIPAFYAVGLLARPASLANDKQFSQLLRRLHRQDWVVYPARSR